MDNADFLAFHQSALSEVNSFLGSVFYYKGTAYVGVINDLELSNDLAEGGLIENLATVIIVPKSVLTVAPKAGERLTIEGKAVRIERVKADEVSFEIHCVTAVR